MIICFVPNCRWKTTCPLLLGTHLRRVHEPLDVYSCAEPNCGRSFGARWSFVNHLRKHLQNDKVDRVHREQNTMLSECRLGNNESYCEDSSEIDLIQHEEQLEEAECEPNTQELIDLKKLTSEFNKISIGFNLKWLNKDTVPRKLVYEFQEDVRNNILKPIEEVVNVMATTGSISITSRHTLSSMLSLFNNFETEFKLTKQLKSMDFYQDPIYFTISNELKPGVVGNKLDMVVDSIKSVLMPIKFQLKKYLEAKDVMKTVVDHLKPSTDGTIRSLVDGEIWKEKIKHMVDKKVIPINIFFDDFTTSDSVSPHASSTKICGIYYYIPCLQNSIIF